MRRWYKEDWRFTITVLLVGSDGRAEACRLGFEPGDTFVSAYECPAHFCPLAMAAAYPLMTAVRSNGDLRQLGGDTARSITFSAPECAVRFRLVAEPVEPPALQ